MTEKCQAAPNGSPIFVLRNVSNTSANPQTITVNIYDRYFTSNPTAKVLGPISLTAGQTMTVTAPAGWPLVSAYGPDHQYYAHFNAVVPTKKNPQGEVQTLKTHEFCVCGQSTDTTSSTTTTTIRFSAECTDRAIGIEPTESGIMPPITGMSGGHCHGLASGTQSSSCAFGRAVERCA